MLLESFSTLGLTYYLFLVGLEMDLSTIRHMDKKSWTIAIIGTIFPFCVGASLYYVPILQRKDVVLAPLGALFWAITLTMTSFPDLARILSDFKLLHTEVGKIALSSTIINDISTWFLFVGTIITSNGIGYEVAIGTIPYIAFVVICLFVLRPSIAWFINRTKKKGGKYSDTHVYFILIGVVIFGCVADACGSHSLVGGYMFGLIIPRGELAINVMERSEKFVTGIMLPSFLISSGLRTTLDDLGIQRNWETLICIIAFATSAKIVSTSIVALCCRMSLRDSLTLGGLMNTKGFFALIVLNEGRSMLVTIYMYILPLIY